MATDKLLALRNQFGKHGITGFVQPVHDKYVSEYPPACYRRVEWLTGFSGSAGTAVVLQNTAALFIDGRYTLQAAGEVDGGLFELHNSGELSPESWIANHANAGSIIGYDPELYTPGMLARLRKTLEPKGVALAPCPNLIDAVWTDRPAAPASALFIHELRYAGETPESKRWRIAKKIIESGADAAVIGAPDSICWLLNIRARDVENTPLALCTAIIDAQASVQLFIDPARCDAAVRAHLGGEVQLSDPAALADALAALGKENRHVLCDPQSVSVWFTQALEKAGATIIEAQDPCILPKATKNAVELQGMRDAHIRDGAAVTKLLCWLDHRRPERPITEIDVCVKLAAFRAAHPMFVEPSFPTIAGSGPHGAIVHYRVSSESNRVLGESELFLLDSGGQYPDGTTDITRTVALGTPSPEQKDRFTRVLKGHIAVAGAIFPAGTPGSQLDALARQFLWQEGLDYDHGTGHGVGHFLGVHEGPQRISKRGGDAPLMPGMIVSNEPGYYKEGQYGIRIENLVAVVEKNTGENGKKYLGFETITCVPIDTRLLETAMLTQKEKAWLNNYHAWVESQLAELLSDSEKIWLRQRCRPVE